MILALPLLLVAATLPSQDPTPPTAQELRAALDAMRASEPGLAGFDAAVVHLPTLIRSRSGWWVAGGAWLAGTHQRSECIPALLDALEHENSRANNVSAMSKEMVLDALVRLEADVPTERLIERIEPETAAETYLLLARAEKPDLDALRSLLDVAPLESGTHWATASLLAQHAAAGLARRLLEQGTFSIDVSVQDPGDDSYHSETYFGQSRMMTAHARWPPLVEWDITPPAPGEALDSARGTRQSHPRRISGPRRIQLDDQLELRVRLIDHLLGESAERGLLGEPLDLTVRWISPKEYERTLRTHFDAVRERILRVALRLEALGRLQDAHEVVERVRVRATIYDGRATPEPKLPKPPALPWVVYETN